MSRNANVWLSGCAAFMAVFLTGCGGGGGSGGGAPGATLLAVTMLPSLPAGGGGGPNAAAALPTAFRDQALTLRFDGPLDAGVFGGFQPAGGPAAEQRAIAQDGSPVPYFAFADQVAARYSLELRRNAALSEVLLTYVVGRHRDDPTTLVIDLSVPSLNPFQLPPSAGLDPGDEYVLHIPAGNALSFGGLSAASFGPDPTTLPVVLATGASAPNFILRASSAFAPDPVPPAIVSIAPIGAAGTPFDPVPIAGPILVTFSKRVDASSFLALQNFVVRNTDVANSNSPGGIAVPGSIEPYTPGAYDTAFVFTPSMPYGPGPGSSEGYDIEVRVGGFGNASVPPILGLPTGVGGVQLPLSNSLSQPFRTARCVGCNLPAVVGTGFGDDLFRDGAFGPSFGGPCRWNEPSAPGVLTGRAIAGSAAGPALGTRIQYSVIPPPPPVGFPAGLFPPFDASLANSGSQCPGSPTGCNLGINPNGGEHIMHLYEAAELGNIEDSLEQIEWSPVGSTTFPTTYPLYSLWCGVSSIAAPASGGSTIPGLFAVFDANYNLVPYQSGIPLAAACAPPSPANPRKVPCGGPVPYVVPLLTTQWVAFPALNPVFDYATSTGASGNGVNLVFEQNIEPGLQAPNFNRYNATSFNPVRRLIDRPLSLVTIGTCAFNLGGTFDIYHARFTFVGVVSQCRSAWFDTGTASPTYVDFVISPPPGLQPAGTRSVWTLEGTSTPNPGPGTVGTSVTYVDAAGVINPGALPALSGLRYFRFRCELRANNVTNLAPTYAEARMAYTIPAGG